MSAIRRVVSQNAFHLRNLSRSGAKTSVVRNMSSVLEGKERGDEARFIREAEAARSEAIRKNVERIMALNDNDSEKEALVSLVEPKKEPSNFVERWGLNDWKIAGPVAILTVGPLIESQYLLMDADMMITGAFLLVCGTVYNQAGPMITNMLRDGAEAEFKALVKADDLVYDQIKAGIDADVHALTLKEDVSSILSLKHDLKVAEAEVLTAQEAHKYRESVVAKLESLQALEDAAVREIRARMISKVQSDVLETFKNDKKVKENALNQAIAVLAGGANAKMGKDVVGEVFTDSLKNYKEFYSKQPEGSDPIIKKLQAEIAVVAAAPAVSSNGGNVYTLGATVSKGHH